MSIFASARPSRMIPAGAAAFALVLLITLYATDAFAPRPMPPKAESETASTAEDMTRSDKEAKRPVATADPVQKPAPLPASRIPAPRIDVFRLDTDGAALVAGTAAPDWQVEILLDGAPFAKATPGADGKFADFIDVPDSTEPRILTLRMVGPDGDASIMGENEVIITPDARQPPDAQVAGLTRRTDAGGDTASEPADAEKSPTSITDWLPNNAAAPAPKPDTNSDQREPSSSSNPAPPPQRTILMSDASGVSVLQPSEPGTAPRVHSSVALDAISYADDGDVLLSGRGVGSGFVRIYLDNKPIADSSISEAGTWRSELPQVDSGVYTLRIDEIDASGQVTSRIESPFKREDRGLLAELQNNEAEGIAEPNAASRDAPISAIRAITVQPGNTLWAISRDTYGEGILYMRVVKANAERIRNPDLIYPGQVFTLPD